MSKIRDKIVARVGNWVFNTFASKEYNERLKFTYVLGLAELERRKDANKTRAMLGNDDYEETR